MTTYDAFNLYKCQKCGKGAHKVSDDPSSKLYHCNHCGSEFESEELPEQVGRSGVPPMSNYEERNS